MTDRTLKTLEYDKVLQLVAEYAVLKGTKQYILSCKPTNHMEEVKAELKKTSEAYKLLFTYGVGSIEFFDEPDDELERAKKGSMLSLAELIRSARLLKSSRLIRNSYLAIEDSEITILPSIAETLYCDQYLEKEILSKVISDEKLSDHASEKLYEIRRKIQKLNGQISEKLAGYIRNQQKYLQDNIVTIRGDRYVIPVKSEFRSKIRGFIHDQSSTGSTVFIEPIEVLELNNQLKSALIDESIEVEEIIRDLSHKIGLISDNLFNNVNAIKEIDFCSARANYAYKTKAVLPIVNNRGYINIINGRHPLIAKEKVVPLSLTLGKDYNILLISGPNTGGKTVTLKLVGLFSLMVMSGMFLPTSPDSEVSIFEDVFCNIGDDQSIEQSLSTFSSHIKSIVNITENANEKSLVLIDEIGAGTDPDEGSALAQAVISYLLDKNTFGIITTHYSKLKEYAYIDKRISNACMEFDSQTYAPIYKINIGFPGSSNALEIAKKIGLDENIVLNAVSLLSENKIDFENVLHEAEKTRQKAQKELEECERIKSTIANDLIGIEQEKKKLSQERAKLYEGAKAEARRIINDKTAEAEELLEQLKEIVAKEELTGGDIITARTIRNKLEDKKYFDNEEENFIKHGKISVSDAKVGTKVFVETLNSYGEIISKPNKHEEVELLVGSMKVKARIKDLVLASEKKPQNKNNDKSKQVKISRQVFSTPTQELNVVGLRREEALDAVTKFLDMAVMGAVPEVRIVHGKGLKILSTSIHELLKREPHVDSFRFGTYGEGENGVTIVTLK